MAYRSFAHTGPIADLSVGANANKPIGVAVGDLILSVFGCDVNNTGITGTGYTLISESLITAPDGQVLAAMGRIATGSDPVAFGYTGSIVQTSIITLAFSNVSAVPSAIQATTNSTANASPVSIALAVNTLTVHAGDTVIVGVVNDQTVQTDKWNFSTITGFTSIDTTQFSDWCSMNVQIFENYPTNSLSTLNLTATIAAGTGNMGWLGFVLILPAGTTITNATIAAIDGADIANIIAANWTNSIIAVTDGADLSNITASVSSTTNANIAAIDSADIAVINASTWTNSAIALTDSPDIAAVSANVATSSAINTTDAPDIAAINAVNWTSANIATSDSPDLTTIATSVTTGATINIIDGADVSAIIAANWTKAQIAVIDSADLLAIATTVGGVTTASISAIDGSDLNAVTAANWATASVSTIDGADVSAIATAVTTGAAIAVVDGADIVVINAANFTNASLALTDAPDLAALIGQVGSITLASIATIDAGDISAITTANWITAALALVDGADVVAITALANALTQASIVLIDGNDITLLVATTSNGQLLKPNSRQILVGLARIRTLNSNRIRLLDK